VQSFHFVMIFQLKKYKQNVPDNDFDADGISVRNNIAHFDLWAASSVLNLNISFHWHPTVDEAIVAKLIAWNVNKTRAPVFILFGNKIFLLMQLSKL
jgi:hypothetical protein